MVRIHTYPSASWERQDYVAIGNDVCQALASMRIVANNIAVIEGDSHIGRWVEESGKLAHDEYALPIVLEYVPVGGVVVDAGAFIGDHTRAYLDKVGPAGVVWAFEPNPDAFRCLVHNCPEAKAFPFGLSDLAGSAGLIKNPNAGASRLSGVGGIVLVRLDDYEFRRLDFLKVDVEGMEVKALRGASDTIKRFKPVMWVEVNRGTLEKNGYEVEELWEVIGDFGYNMKLYPEGGGDQYDLLCLPR